MIFYVLKTLWRHRIRSFLTVAGSAIAMFVFCCVGSVQQGLDQLVSGEDAEQRLIVFQENRFCPTTSKLPQDYADRIRKIDGVVEVIPIQVWTNNCRASLDIVVFNGANKNQIRKNRPLELIEGNWSDFLSQQDAAIVGRNIANRRGIGTGDQFSIGEISVKVTGIFQSTIASEENLIYTGLSFLQYTKGLAATGLVTQHEVVLSDNVDPDRIANEIDSALNAGPVATATRRKGAFQTSTLSDLVDLIGFAHWLGYACVGLVLSLVATTTIMSVQDRIKEYAVLQTIGIRPLSALRLVLTESTLLCFIGGLTGTGLALIALLLGGYAIGAEGATIAFRPSFQLFLSGAIVSLIIGLLSGLAPAIHAATLPIVKSLNQT